MLSVYRDVATAESVAMTGASPQEVMRMHFYRRVEQLGRAVAAELLGVRLQHVDFLRFGHRRVTPEYLGAVTDAEDTSRMFAKLAGIATEMAATGEEAPRRSTRTPTTPGTGALVPELASKTEADVLRRERQAASARAAKAGARTTKRPGTASR